VLLLNAVVLLLQRPGMLKPGMFPSSAALSVSNSQGMCIIFHFYVYWIFMCIMFLCIFYSVCAEEDRRGISASEALAPPGFRIRGGQRQGPSLCQQPDPRGVQTQDSRGVQDPWQGEEEQQHGDSHPTGWHPCGGYAKGQHDRWQA